MANRIFVCLIIALALTAAPRAASAAIWEWGCQGQLGEQQIIFNKDEFIILKAAATPKKPRAFNIDTFSNAMTAAKQNKEPIATYVAHGGGGGLEATMEFARSDDDKRLVMFTEKSSRRVSHKHKNICWRDEDTDVYRKTYRYEREHEPARDITMQCYEYQLSTKGGHEGCD